MQKKSCQEVAYIVIFFKVCSRWESSNNDFPHIVHNVDEDYKIPVF